MPSLTTMLVRRRRYTSCPVARVGYRGKISADKRGREAAAAKKSQH